MEQRTETIETSFYTSDEVRELLQVAGVKISDDAVLSVEQSVTGFLLKIQRRYDTTWSAAPSISGAASLTLGPATTAAINEAQGDEQASD